MIKTKNAKIFLCLSCVCLIICTVFSIVTVQAAQQAPNLADGIQLSDSPVYCSLYDLKQYNNVLKKQQNYTYPETIFVAKNQSVYIEAKKINVNSRYISVTPSSQTNLYKIQVTALKTNTPFNIKITNTAGKTATFPLQIDYKDMTSIYAYSDGTYNGVPATWGLEANIYGGNQTNRAEYIKRMSLLSQSRVSNSSGSNTPKGNDPVKLTTGFGANGGVIIRNNFAFKKVTLSYDTVNNSKLTPILTWTGNAATILYENGSKGDKMYITMTDTFGKQSQLVLTVSQ